MSATTVAVILLAVFVGATIPVLIQLTLTLRAARKQMDSSGRRLDRALDEVTKATQRINRVGEGLEDSVQRVREVVDTVSGLGESVTRLRDSIRTATAIGNAVGPAIAAAIRAFMEREPSGQPATELSESNEETDPGSTSEETR